MAKNGTINLVRKALEKGFAAKGTKVRLFTEKSDYKDFVRMFVISDYFRGKGDKERLGEFFRSWKRTARGTRLPRSHYVSQ